ncbi:MAG: glycosyltransferase family 4 protein [Colwellia sp.]|nr:glycosyltransferase family 4 protein [Colwellia sp.]
MDQSPKELLIGLTEQHGMAVEQVNYPPQNINYIFLEYLNKGHPVMHSPLKGFMSSFDEGDCDAIEAILTPAKTKKPWFYSLAMYQEALAFSFLGLPIPKMIRAKYMEYLFSQDNFKKLIFWSEAGKKTLTSYGNVTNSVILEKSTVVYPAIRSVDEQFIQYKKDPINLLFNGNFFIKGGVNVVDAFEIMQKEYPSLQLTLCCDEDIDFHTGDEELKQKYLKKIRENKNITMGRVPRDTFLNKLLPNTDIYVLPTYGDAFGFAVLEAMAYGIPVISTNYMAIPEMMVQGETGYMINISQYDCLKMFKGCYVTILPLDFSNYVTNTLVKYLAELLSSIEIRKSFGAKAIDITKSKFSFEQRAQRMHDIYRSSL